MRSEVSSFRYLHTNTARYARRRNMFTPLGRYIFSVDMMLRLKRRLRFAKYVNSLPPSTLNQPSSVEVNAPIVIVGLPRTGSTMISRLLSADPNSRSPLYWEFAHDSDDVSPADPAKADLDYRAKVSLALRT